MKYAPFAAMVLTAIVLTAYLVWVAVDTIRDARSDRHITK